MTYRERREAKAERLREWADKRETKAQSTLAADESIRHDLAFNSQPGHMPFRAKIIAREDRAYESLRKASDFRSRADGIEAAADNAIYSDDPDAIERLEARIAELEAERTQIKAANATFRKVHKAQLAGMSSYERNQALPFPSFKLTNLGGNIARNKKRLEELRTQ